MDLLYSRQHFDFADVEFGVSADSAENGLARTGGAVDLEAHLDQLIDHMLDLIFTGRILHGYDHECARLAGEVRIGCRTAGPSLRSG
jgi:hypothetical protein